MYNRTTNLDTITEHFQNGRNFQRRGLLEEAARQFLKVIKLDSRSASAYFNIGAIYFQQHRYEEAVCHYKAGLELAPQHASAHADLGKTYEMLTKWDEGLYHLDKALNLNPTHEVAQRRKRRILEEKHKYEMLREQAKSVIESMPTSDNINAVAIERFTVNFDEKVPEQVRIPIHRLLERIYTELGSNFDYYPQQNIKVFVLYTSQEEKLQLFPQWAVGRYDGSIVCQIQEKPNLSLIYVVLQHEYVHLLVNMLTNGRYPIWLNEGLAKYHARGLLNSEKEILLQAVKQNRYIPLKDLESNFSYLHKRQIRLAYMESCSVVEFMIETYGMTKIKKLLHSLRMGKSFNESLICSLSTAKKRRFMVNSPPDEDQVLAMISQKELETQWLTWVMDCYR